MMRRSPRVKWVQEKFRERCANVVVLDIGFVGSYEDPFLHLSLRQQNEATQIIGIDINLEGVLRCHLPRTLVADGMWLPFKNNYFDVVLCLEVIEHLDCPQKIFSEIWRVLRPEGKMILTTPNAWSWWNVLRHWMLGTLSSRSSSTVYNSYLGAPDHKVFYEPLSLMNLLHDKGFKVIELCTKNHPVPLLRRFIKQLGVVDLQFFPMNRLGDYICFIAEKVNRSFLG